MFWRRRSENATVPFEEIDALVAENREGRDPVRDRQILRLRHAAGAQLVGSANGSVEHPRPTAAPAETGSGLPEVAPSELDAQVLRAAILDKGCLVIRGLIDRTTAESMVEEMEHAFDAREEVGEHGTDELAYWDRFEPDPPFELKDRDWVSSTGSIWAADSPRLMFDVLDTFERVGLRKVITDYLGERPAISVNKCTLRRVDSSAGTAWHQDGAFLGDGVRALNVWVSLSNCGVDAPGLDIIPKRIDHIVSTGGEGAIFEWSVSDEVAREAAGDAGVLRPTFEPGDVVLFDDLFLHRTAVEPEMPGTRYAIESWFFGPTGFPAEYTPIGF
jgi:hypothetical protein